MNNIRGNIYNIFYADILEKYNHSTKSDSQKVRITNERLVQTTAHSLPISGPFPRHFLCLSEDAQQIPGTGFGGIPFPDSQKYTLQFAASNHDRL